jgi:hypothetical protein
VLIGVALLLGKGFFARHPPRSPSSSPPRLPEPWSAAHATWGARAHLTDIALDECSGIVKSRRYPGVYWVHNDSGDSARIFAVDGFGNRIGEVAIDGARNVDWEEITADDAGRLYICDIGNNRSDRRDLAIYVVPEPDPWRDRRVALAERIGFRYPDQVVFPDPTQSHDGEAAFWHSGQLYVLTKRRGDLWTRLYRFPDRDAMTPAGTAHAADPAQRAGAGEVTITLVDSLAVGSLVTAASLDPEGKELAILAFEYLVLCAFDPQAVRPLGGGPARRLLFEGRQSEAIAHEGEVLRIVNEQREVHLLARDAVEEASEPIHEVLVREFTANPDAPEAIRRGYLPQPPIVSGTGDRERALMLTAAAGERLEPAPPEVLPPIRCELGTQILTLHVDWPAPPTRGGSPERVLFVAWGPPGARALPGPDDAVWEVNAMTGNFELELIAGGEDAPRPIVELSRRRDGHVGGRIGIPFSGPLALNVNLMSPEGGEWCFGGDWSMRGPLNPFLWGVILDH